MNFSYKKAQKIKEDKGFSFSWLEKKTGIKQRYLSQFFRGERNPSMDHIKAIAKAIEIDIDNLII